MLGIIISFISAFEYAYYAALFHRVSDSSRLHFMMIDRVYSIFFTIDLVVHIFLNEHQESEGQWSVKKSCLKQIYGNLILNLLALCPFPYLFRNMFNPKVC